MDFQGGRILEPACGIGHFIGLMPEEMLRRSTITGIEIDPLTARIAKALYPDADIREQPFEKSKLADGSFDLAISNVPFGDYTVHDPRWNDYKFPIHDYFFAAALDKVRPGGLVMFVTSRTARWTNWIRRCVSCSRAKTELLGAIRLPNNAFKKNAGTEVTTDIVMLRKLRAGESPRGPAWKAAVDFTNDQSGKFCPQRILRRPSRNDAGQNAARRAGCIGTTNRRWNRTAGIWARRWRRPSRGCPKTFTKLQTQRVAEKTFDPDIPAPDYIKPNAYCVHEDGRVCIREDGVLRPLDDMPVETRSRIRRLIEVRDAVRDCLRSQLDGSGEEQVVEAREQLNLAYDRFVARFGPINARVNQRAFRRRPRFAAAAFAGELRRGNQTWRSKPRFSASAPSITNSRFNPSSSPKEALLVSLNEKGRVDLDHMAGLLTRPAEEFLPDLKGMIFLNPQTNQWETEDQYLSGNVREKLIAADAASVTDPRFRENVEALKSVQPAGFARHRN